MATRDMWTWRDQSWTALDLVGYDVEAVDGGIGKVDEATHDVGGSYVVVDTGPWIFGSKVLLPAGVIDTVDVDDGKVFVNRTKDDIKNAPEFGEDKYRDDAYRGDVGGYYTSRTTDRDRANY
jgi:hypothetical protein